MHCQNLLDCSRACDQAIQCFCLKCYLTLAQQAEIALGLVGKLLNRQDSDHPGQALQGMEAPKQVADQRPLALRFTCVLKRKDRMPQRRQVLITLGIEVIEKLLDKEIIRMLCQPAYA